MKSCLRLSSLVACILAQVSPASAIREAGYSEVFATDVLPYCLENGVSGSFLGRERIRIAWVKYEVENEAGALVILGGRSECHAKYAEVIYDLRDLGFSIYLMDHCGQGASGRLLQDPEKGHIERFADYVEDLEIFIDTVVDARPHARRFLLAHSMGGCIGSLFAEEHHEAFDGIILCAPMFDIRTDPYPKPIAYAMVSIFDAFGLGRAYAPNRRAHDPRAPFEGNDKTHSRVRYERNMHLIADNPMLALGGPTNHWVKEAMRATRVAKAGASGLVAPTLLLEAGDDHTVDPRGYESVMQSAANGRKVVLPEAYHEILMETDSIRDLALREIRAFLIEGSRGCGRATIRER